MRHSMSSKAIFFAACFASLAAANPDAPATDGTTALHRAVSVGDVAKAESLIRAGSDVNAVSRYGVTPLSLAAAGGRARLLEALFKSGADALSIIKWKEIYDLMETATDRCEDVANVIEGVVLEHA